MSEGGDRHRLDILLECEGELRVEFKRCVGQLMTEGHPPRNKWEIYFLMQHYDVPTRLLDWTDGALMALHFAISRRGGDDDMRGKESPAVYMLDPWSLNAEAFKHCELVSEGAQAVGVALPDWRAAKPYLKSEFSSDKLGLWCPLAIDPSHFSRRIAAQRSHFTIFGRDPDGLTKAAKEEDVRLRTFEFDGTEIESLKRALRVCGISESVAYPDLGGLGRELKEVLTGYLPERLQKH
jgi:hypothetical protein